MVEQLPILFHGTLRENIAYARPIGRAAGASGPRGGSSLPLDTHVGDRGSALSAGERQRVVIARVLLRDPRVVILDEPVAALDFATRLAVRDALRRALQGRTYLVITHDQSVVEGNLLRLEQGVIETCAAAMLA